jgi:hypothetical protein
MMKIDGTIIENNQDRMAYWLNLYNGLVLRDVLKRYPVQTVAQIPNFFSEPRYEMASFPGKKVSLLDIEQYFREKFNDPRLHLARVNASMGAPPLMQEAYQAEKFDKQIEEETMNFLKDSTKNFYDPHKNIFYASAILMWFNEDFYPLPSGLSLAAAPASEVSDSVLGLHWKLNDTVS